ncbi:MAG: hypothetical protein HY566_03110 [Candidatus Kerfeldbacteria bacterium]|nr:hypothetical protein [Candidatus Kerfeldbacteria bacterium]
MAEEKLDAVPQENYRTEYKEVAANHRFYAGLRFIVAAFTATMQSALFTFYNQALKQPAPQARATIISVVGLLTITAVMVIEQRNVSLFRAMIRRGKELEFNLGIADGLFSRLSEPRLVRPKGLRRIITHTWGIGFTYGVIYIIWLALVAFSLINR